MNLHVRDVARLFGVSEKTVRHWIRGKDLPAHRVDDHYRFNEVELQEWAAAQKRRISLELFAPDGRLAELPSLGDALERGGIFHDVPGSTRDEVLKAVGQLPGIPRGIDRGLLYELLVGREALASTGVGDGIAIPHPRDPLVLQVAAPLALLCFLREPVDFRAPDGQAVRVLFLLLSPTVRCHLQMVSKLAFVLHDQALKELLQASAPESEILKRVRALEQDTSGPTVPAESE
ncbi:MAG: PTS sugar transporter subunit IIA [Candidatus Binatus sp.]|uniref:PTS sugar transporter subunit IIA n=1 Tax=Candidatus Binatus sp. TaxID=2811406 RepID=UPI00271EDC04|nr:PTS sugar transporter subunit IIA [Candidatus Binatus sp.]MDO8432315.1 PTS sugar transporter subunit IIA [Candidatus Binatus sp.]